MGLFRDNETVIQIEHNMFKNPNWQQANQLAFYSLAEDLNSAKTSKNQSSQRSTAWPCCIHSVAQKPVLGCFI